MKANEAEYKMTVFHAVLLVLAFLILALVIPAALNSTLWRPFFGGLSVWINILCLIIISVIFFAFTAKITEHKVPAFAHTNIAGVLSAVGCALLFFLLLDCFLDPFLDGLFPASAAEYQQALVTLRQSPITTFIQVCLFAPIAEEILMRGYVLAGLKSKYGTSAALIISTLLFAILHFNFVQTLSAVICGLVIGFLYIRTKSLFCCILTHFLYNSISYFTHIVLLR